MFAVWLTHFLQKPVPTKATPAGGTGAAAAGSPMAATPPKMPQAGEEAQGSTPPPREGPSTSSANATSTTSNSTAERTKIQRKSVAMDRRFSVSDILFGSGEEFSGEPPTALEFVLKSFLGQWLAQADAKLREFTQAGDALMIFDLQFQRLLDSLGRVSRRSLGNVANVVLTWRKNRITAAMSSGLKSSNTNVMDDKVVLGAELLCCETIISILRFISKDNLGDMEWCSELEQACFANVVPSKGNNDEIRSKYALVLGFLAPFRLQEISAKFKTHVNQFQAKPDAKNQAMLEPILAALAHLKLDISSVANYTQVIGLVSVFVDLIAGTKGKHEDLRPLLVQSLATMLHPLLAYSRQLPAGVDYGKWFQFVSASYASLYAKLVDIKNPSESRTLTYPLLVTLLCLQEKEVFVATYSILAEHITQPKTIKKDKKTGDRPNFTFLLEALYILVNRFLTQEFANSHLLAQGNLLELVTTRLFEIRDRKLGPLPDESLGWMVDILSKMAEKNPTLTLRDISKLLVATDPGFLQKKIVGVRTLMMLYDAGVDVAEHSPTIGEVMSEVFTAVHNELGVNLMTTGRPPPDEKDPLVVLLCETIASCFYIMPVKIGTTKLFAILASYFIHSSASVREAAEKCLTRILVHRVGLRAPLIQIIAEMPLAISDFKPSVLEIALDKLNLMLAKWSEIMVSGPGDEPLELNVAQLEGIALMFLCSSRAKVRLMAWRCIELLRTLVQAAPRGVAAYASKKQGEPTSSVRLLTLMEEMEAEVIQTFNNDFHFRRIENPTFRRFDNMTLQSLIANEATAAAQLCWTYCLGACLRMGQQLCSEACTVARNLIVLRYHKIPVVPEKTQLTQEHSFSIGLWRNYALLFAVTTNRQSFEFDDWVTAQTRGDTSFLATPQLMLQDIVTKTATNPIYQQAGTMALGRICSALLPTLCSTLDELIVEGKAMKKAPARKAGSLSPQHWEILASLYARAAEGLIEDRGILQRDPVLRKYFINFLSELVKSLSSGPDSILEMELFPQRYSLLVLARCVAEELNMSQKGRAHELDKQLRQHLFHYLTKWAQGVMLIDSYPQLMEQIGAKLKQARSTEKPEDFKNALRDQLQVLQYFAVRAMGALMNAPWDPPHSKDSAPVVWLNKNLHDTFTVSKTGSNLRMAAQDAVAMYLLGNHAQWGSIPMALAQCFTKETDELSVHVANTWFIAIVEVMEMRPEGQRPLPDLLHLVMCRIGDSNLQIRRHALKLLQLVSFATGAARWEEFDALAIDSELDDTYRYTQQRLSDKLADAYEANAPRVFDEMVVRTDFMSKVTLDQALDYIVPWLARLKLYLCSESMRSHSLYNMCLLTHLYQGDRPVQVQKLWSTLASDQGNVDPIIEFLLRVGVRKRNAAFIPLAKKIVLYISRANGEITVSKLVDELQAVDKGDKPKLMRMASPRGGLGKPVVGATQVGSLEPDHPFHHVMPDGGNNVLTVVRGHLALILTSELAFEVGEKLRDHLAVILQQVFLGFHHPQPIIYDHSRMLLLNLVHKLVIDRYSQTQEELIPHEDYEEALQLVELLKGRARKPLFHSANQLNTLLTTLVESVVSVLTPKYEEAPTLDYHPLSDLWAEQAFQWALKCPVLHLSSISYQIYRALCPSASKEELALMLESLSKMLKAKGPESEKLSGQIILTLKAVLEQTDVNNLTLYTQVFWGANALLNTDFEEQFVQGCTILEAVVSALNFSDMVVSNVFLASIPEADMFGGVQTKLIRGLWSPASEPYTVKLLVKFLSIPSTCDRIIQPRLRVMSAVVSLLPFLCIEGRAEKTHDVAEKLGRFVQSAGLKELGNAFIHNSKSSKDVPSFLSSIAGPLVEAFFAQNDLFIIMFFFDLLDRGPVKYNKPLLHILEVLVPHVSLQSPTFQGRVPLWMTTLERLVHGPLVELALELLDRCMAHSQGVVKGSISLASVAVLGPEYTTHPEFSNTQDEGTLLASSELAALVKQSGLAGGAEGGVEELASQAFFAKFFPESDDSGSSHMEPGSSDTMRMDDFNDEMLLGGFGTGSNTAGDFFNMMSELDSAGGVTVSGSEGQALLEKHSQLHDQYNNYIQQTKFPMATEMAFELGQVLFDGYVKAFQGVTFVDEEVTLLVSKYDKMLQGTKLAEQFKVFSSGFKSSSASQALQNLSKADRQVAEQSLKTALFAFNDQHSLYLAAKAGFDKKSHEKTKASEIKRLQAAIDLHLQFVRLLKKLAELRLSYDGLLGKLKDAQQHIAVLVSSEERNRALLSESQSLG